jgi:hypothetical protein
MVVVYVNVYLGSSREIGKSADAAFLSRIHQNQAPDPVEVNVLDLREVKKVAG